MTSPLNPSGKKHRFGKAWMHEHVTDPYVREAARRGYRSRAAFKLMELDARDRLLRPGIAAVDLGAAPGSWSQVLHERLGRDAKIVAIDLLPMQPIHGVDFVRGDVEQDEGVAALEAALGGRRPDLVLCDMSPNLSGIDVVDQARSMRQAELALDFACTHLQPGGDLVVKVFQGAGLDAFVRDVRGRFSKVYLRKPKASRDRSREHYLVAKGLLGGGAAVASGDKPGNTARRAKNDTREPTGATNRHGGAGRMNLFRRGRRRHARMPRPVGGRPERSTAARSIA